MRLAELQLKIVAGNVGFRQHRGGRRAEAVYSSFVRASSSCRPHSRVSSTDPLSWPGGIKPRVQGRRGFRIVASSGACRNRLRTHSHDPCSSSVISGGSRSCDHAAGSLQIRASQRQVGVTANQGTLSPRRHRTLPRQNPENVGLDRVATVEVFRKKRAPRPSANSQRHDARMICRRTRQSWA